MSQRPSQRSYQQLAMDDDLKGEEGHYSAFHNGGSDQFSTCTGSRFCNSEKSSIFVDSETNRGSTNNGSVAPDVSFSEFFINSRGPPQLVLVCIIIALSLGSVVGAVPAIMTDRLARDKFGYSGEETCFETDVKPEECTKGNNLAQDYSALSSLVSNLLTFACSAMIGTISDCHGRKLFLVYGILLSLLPSSALVVTQQYDIDPFWYYMLNSIGGVINWIAIAFSALSDVVPNQFRAASYGLLLAGFSVGFALSPMLSLTLSFLQVSVVSFLLLTFGLVYAIYFLDETLSEETSQANIVRQQSLLESRQGVAEVVLRPVRELSILNRDNFFRKVALLAFFSGLALSGDRGLLIYYLQDRLSFGNKDIATVFLIAGLLGIVVQGCLLNPLTHKIGEKNIVVLSFIFGAVHNVMYGLAKSKNIIFVGVIFSSFSALSFPTISSIKSNNVDETEQGRVQGALYSVASLAAALGPLSLRAVYRSPTSNEIPGLMFLFGASLYLIASIGACSLPKMRTDSSLMSANQSAEALSTRNEVDRSDQNLVSGYPEMSVGVMA